MHILKSNYKNIIYFQIYLTKEETENKDIQNKIKQIKNPNTRIALFVSGENDYKKILEKIIISEVKKVNGL